MAMPELIPDEFAITEDRRLRVQAMRLRRLSARAIAAVLNEDVAVIQGDLEWIRTQNSEKYGAAPTLDRAQEIGWAVADFEEMESVAWIEFHSLKQEAQKRNLSPMFVARARQGWIRTAAMMRVLRIKLLAEHRYLQEQMSTMSPQASLRADDIRSMLRAEGLLLEVAQASEAKSLAAALPVIDAEAEEDVEDAGDPISRWVDEGGFFGEDGEE